MTEHFFALYTYAFASGNTRPISSISTQSCAACRRVIENAEYNRKHHYSTQGRQFTIKSFASAWEPNQQAAIAAKVHQAAGTDVKDDGTVAGKDPSEDLSLLVRLEWRSGGWIVNSVEATDQP